MSGSIDKTAYKSISDVIQNIYNDSGIRVESVSVDWANFQSIGGDSNSVVLGVKLVAHLKIH